MNLFRRNKTDICQAVPFIYAYARNSKRPAAYKRKYRCVARHLADFEKEREITILSNSFSAAVCEDFLFFLKDKTLKNNTIRNYLHYTFFMFRRMGKAGFSVDFSFEETEIKKEHSRAIYLNINEIRAIYNLKIKETNSRKIRDLFVIGCYTGLRFSDLSQLTNRNIIGNKIVTKTRKTGEVVEIPLHPLVSEIIRYHNGIPACDCSLFNFNKCIKTVCKRANITDKILIERTKGHKIERFTTPKYALVSSHTARRSFATNAYLSGILPAKIMLITGHKSEQTFFEYIRIGKAENARELAEHAFFKD
ncbi:MAG: site-specific integrase [Dysgonamonadaceae bacterium]|jgi:integrase|nr:site-specific integrase [Dysgonamonadaceae bacterium]